MPNEDIEIRITKSGEIYVKIVGAEEARVRDYRSFLEEMIGPIKSETQLSTPPWEKPLFQADLDEHTREQEQKRGT
ncbi:MAG: hypothetical protein D6691_07760 [Candidatus Hydrogenedentota bacterium]|jgi:antitoxin (DNA-binding transcriptional repressor) of toxin-antitoxin stability system|uniref:Uncharacterized protein n=1 Tax=Sumerlaea chitinivorans TaxID=2250252 RepID=A0A2Z4Y5T5_SUMC1|nr:hypothetical protein BRCON_1008 [Candidatus Sumerlaea chitinivorans]MCX7963735.1 hypothetical protein [Candidatus Sumerlaea chitinivorans]RMH26577.1 MAG: hypothetical protein D6691_07760 [Candidatus Hydrogenedentota bacterium]GIX44255.1 MAG: hypothetical protein KatS3mg130_0663 [Candidatus Sumerlaea sp.]